MEIIKLDRFIPGSRYRDSSCGGIRVENWFGDIPVTLDIANTIILPNLEELTSGLRVPTQDKVRMLSVAVCAGLEDLPLSKITILNRETCLFDDGSVSFRNILGLPSQENGIFYTVYNPNKLKFEKVGRIDPRNIIPNKV